MGALKALTALVARHAVPGGGPTAGEGRALIRAEAVTGRFGALYEPSLCVVLQGAKTTLLGEQVFHYDAGKYLIAPVDLPAIAQIAEASQFWAAEDYHQDYYRKNPIRYKVYRFGCGRDRRLKELWGDEN